MTYGRIINDVVEIGNPSRLPTYFDGRWWDNRDPEIRAQYIVAAGWKIVIEASRPLDTETETWEPTYVITDLTDITQVWVSRSWTPEELIAKSTQAGRESDRQSIINNALVWLAADSAQAAVRVTQIAQAIADIDNQIDNVNNYTFSGTTVAQINTSLNNALKPQIVSILTQQKQIAQQLQELNVARDKHGDALVWLSRYLTN